jgi:two-component system, chemotaxis family, sensor kinase CheA
MSDPSLIIDPALLAEFIDESSDMLASTDALFMELEARPDDLDIVQAIFRPVHSIKGNSAFFGFGKIKVLAHEAETLLDKIRKRSLTVTPALISVLLKATDGLKAMLERARCGEPEVDDDQAFNALVTEVRAAATSERPSDAAVIAGAIDRIGRVRKRLRSSDPDLKAELDEVSGMLEGLAPVPPKKHGQTAGEPPSARALRELLATPIESKASEQTVAATGAALAELSALAATEEARAAVAEMTDTFDTFMASVGFDNLLRELLAEKLGSLSKPGSWQTPPPGDTPAERPAQAAKDPGAHVEQIKTMRVSEAHIDTFLSYVGELLVVGDMFNHLQGRLASGHSDNGLVSQFRRINETFAALSQNLQRSIMSIRKVPVGVLLKRAPRLVRDVAAKSGKEILVVTEGEEVEADKSLVDLLDAPLTHMARNAADHGIEPPDEREAAGKPRQGTVWLRAEETDTSILLTVRDDGKGIDREALREKAVGMGLVKPGQPLTEDEVIRLLFSSGVSTAKSITDVSGRGVGMDVVRRMVEDANGQIRITSEPGKGSVFSIQLPKSVTTQIMDGFLVETGENCYVLPMDRIRETMKVARNDLLSVKGKGMCIRHHDMLLPVVDLREALRLDPPDEVPEDVLLVTVNSRTTGFALAIDAVRGGAASRVPNHGGVGTGPSGAGWGRAAGRRFGGHHPERGRAGRLKTPGVSPVAGRSRGRPGGCGREGATRRPRRARRPPWACRRPRWFSRPGRWSWRPGRA